MMTFYPSQFKHLERRGPFRAKKRPCKCHRHYYILDYKGQKLGEMEFELDALAVVEGLNRLFGYKDPVG